MNIHPIFVHFPIALFTLYAFFEVSRFGFIIRQPWYFYVKAVLVIAGSALSFITLITGLMAEKFMEGHPALIYHKVFALATSTIFFIIAAAYALTWHANYRASLGIVFEYSLVKLAQTAINGNAVVALAVFGFICLTITAGLGGAMVYGAEADPFFKPIYYFLVPR